MTLGIQDNDLTGREMATHKEVMVVGIAEGLGIITHSTMVKVRLRLVAISMN